MTVLRHAVVHNALALVLLQAFMYTAPLAALVYLTGVLDVESYGIFAFTVGLVQFSNSVLDLGLTLSATPRIATHRHRRSVVNRIVGAAFALKLVGVLLCSIVIGCYVMKTDRYGDYRAVLALSIPAIAGYALQPIWFFQGVERMLYITRYVVVSKLLYLGLLVMFVRSPGDLYLAVAADSIAGLVGAVVANYSMLRLGYKPSMPSLRDIRYVVAFTWPYFVSRFAITIYSSGGVAILGFFIGPAATGVYALGERIYQAMQQLFSPLTQALYPHLARTRDHRLLLRVGVALVALSGALCGLLLLKGDQIIMFFFGSEWVGSYAVVSIFAISIVIYVFSLISGYPMSAVLGTYSTANNSLNIGVLVYAIAVGWVIFQGQANAQSLAFSLLFAEAAVLIHRAIVNWPRIMKKWLSVAPLE